MIRFSFKTTMLTLLPAIADFPGLERLSVIKFKERQCSRKTLLIISDSDRKNRKT